MSQPSFVEIFERTLVPWIFRPWAIDLLDRTQPAATDRVLDVACGTGIVARIARERLGAATRIAGLDINPDMIAMARSIAPEIEWHQGSAVEMKLETGSFDFVFCQQGLQFFPDRAAAVREMRRVLGNGGRIAISTWRPVEEHALVHGLRRAAACHAEVPIDKRYSFGDADALRTLLVGAGFREVKIETVTHTSRFPDAALAVRLHLSVIVPALATMSEEARAKLIAVIRADAAETLAQFADGAGLAEPLSANVATAIV